MIEPQSPRVRALLHRHGIFTTTRSSGRRALLIQGNLVKRGFSAEPKYAIAVTAADKRRTNDVTLTQVSRRRPPSR
jgi:hypothetical protein